MDVMFQSVVSAAVALGLVAADARATAQAGGFTYLGEIVSSDVGSTNGFGRGLACSGDRLFVGDPLLPVASGGTGAVFVFDRMPDGSWSEVARMDASTGVEGLGTDLDVDGDRLVVGTKDDGAFVMDVASDGSLSLDAWLHASSTPYFGGTSVAVSGDTVLVGGGAVVQEYYTVAYYDLVDYYRTRVFVRQGDGSWTLELEAMGGRALDVEGDDAVSLWYYPTHPCFGLNNFFVYHSRAIELVRSQGVWSAIVPGSFVFGAMSFGQSILTPCGNMQIPFAQNVVDPVFDGDRLLVGQPAGSAGTGATVLFDTASAASQNFGVPVVSPTAASSARFGSAVALDGGLMLAVDGSSFGSSPFLPIVHVFGGVAPATPRYLGTYDPAIATAVPRVAIAGNQILVVVDDGSTSSIHVVGVPTLLAEQVDLSIDAPNSQSLSLRAGDAFANAVYMIFGSASGTTPGVDLGDIVVPLNYDGYADFTLHGAPMIENQLGFLDAKGNASARIVLPSGMWPGLAGLTLNHAYVAIDLVAWEAMASNPVPVEIVP